MRAIFSEVWDSERFQTAEVTYEVNQIRCNGGFR